MTVSLTKNSFWIHFSTVFQFLEPISSTDDPVLHTVQTIGALSNKVGRRVYRTVSKQVRLLKKEDVHDYVASLIAVLRLTQYLNFINEKVQKQQKEQSNSGPPPPPPKQVKESLNM